MDAVDPEKVEGIFQSTPSTRRETLKALLNDSPIFPFQSTPSTRRETKLYCTILYIHTFQSTPSTRRETDDTWEAAQRKRISIHSLHTEGDSMNTENLKAARNFNPLPPHGGRRSRNPKRKRGETFQSTPSTRRETVRHNSANCVPFISIHSLHTEGDANTFAERSEALKISIHSLHTEGDA